MPVAENCGARLLPFNLTSQLYSLDTVRGSTFPLEFGRNHMDTVICDAPSRLELSDTET